MNPEGGARAMQAGRFDRLAAEAVLVGDHARVAAARVRSGDVARAGAHALALEGHLVHIRPLLDEIAADHASRSNAVR